jgi:hypothetical protein
VVVVAECVVEFAAEVVERVVKIVVEWAVAGWDAVG